MGIVLALKYTNNVVKHFNVKSKAAVSAVNCADTNNKTSKPSALTPAVTDQSDGCGAKFSAVIVSPKFEGKPLLQRHRMVNGVLEEELKVIHAFSQQTLTPQQWQEKN